MSPGRTEAPAQDEAPMQLALEAAYTQTRRDFGRFNLALFGPTGVGKSTLINAVFGVRLAATGVGQPITKGSHLYRQQTSTIGILDTQGLEVGQHDAEVLHDLRVLIDARLLAPVSEHVHVAWYCVRAGSRRFQDSEEAFVRQLADIGLPVLLVITQSPLTNEQTTDGSTATLQTDEAKRTRELVADISNRQLPVVEDRVFLVNAEADDWMGAHAHGLDRLLDASSAAAPAGVRAALAAAQVVNRRQKRYQGELVVESTVEQLDGKFLLRDLVGRWARMVAGISTIYGLPEDEAKVVLSNSPHISRLRRVLFTGRVLLASTVLSLPGAAVAGTTQVRRLLSRKGKAEEVVAASESGTGTASAAGTPSQAPAPAPEAEPQYLGTDDDVVEDHRVHTGFVAGTTTRAIGDAWLNTCDDFWRRAYPDPPVWNSDSFTQRFGNELNARMPRGMRVKMEPHRRRSGSCKC